MWLDECRTVALEVSGFCLQNDENTSAFNSAQFAVLARPFTDVNPGGPNSEFLSFPGLATGTVSVTNELNKFCGATLAARCPICVGCNYRAERPGRAPVPEPGRDPDDRRDPSWAARTTRSRAGPAPSSLPPTGSGPRTSTAAAFVGLNGYYNHGCWVLGAYGTFGAGCNRQTVDISGSLVTIPAGGTASVQPGALLALPGRNIGSFDNNEFSTASELGVTVGYQITSNIQIFGGYSCLYWTNVVRPGSEIDPVLDTTRIPNFGGTAPTSVRPFVPFNQVDFWAQGVSAGIRFSW